MFSRKESKENPILLAFAGAPSCPLGGLCVRMWAAGSEAATAGGDSVTGGDSFLAEAP